MVSKTEEVGSGRFDSVKLVLAIAILLAGITGFYLFEGESLLYRVLAVVAAAAVAVGIAYTTTLGQAVAAFARESRMEVRKVVWPTREETMQTTLMVIAAVILIGIFLWIVDMILANAIQFLTGTGG